MSFHTASRCSQQPMALPVSAVVGLLFVPVAFLAQPPSAVAESLDFAGDMKAS